MALDDMNALLQTCHLCLSVQEMTVQLAENEWSRYWLTSLTQNFRGSNYQKCSKHQIYSNGIGLSHVDSH